jgi:hypothetical protein
VDVIEIARLESQRGCGRNHGARQAGERAVYPTVPPRVEYGLTPFGVEAGRLTAAIADWSVAHVKEIFAARDAYDVQATINPQPLVTTPRRAS